MAKFSFAVCRPCPYCGQNLRVLWAAGASGMTGYGHTAEGDCFMKGVFIGAALIERFNKRVEK